MISKKRGFTLIEMLAVIVILAIILAIAIPSVLGIIRSSKKSSFESDAKVIIRAVETKTLSDKDYDVNDLSVDNIKEELGIAPNNYKTISVTTTGTDRKIFIYIEGKDKWTGLTVNGTETDITVTDNVKLLATGDITKSGTSGSVTYSYYNNGDFIIRASGDGEMANNFNARKATIERYFVDPNDDDLYQRYLEMMSYGQTAEAIANSITREGYLTYSEAFDLVSTALISIFGANGVQVYNNLPTLSPEIKTLILNNGLKVINDTAFASLGITKVTLPDSLTSIGNSAFEGSMLTSIAIPDNVRTIGNGAFCSGQLASVIIPNSVISIGSSAFQSNQLTNVVIPNSVTSIGYFAFSYNQLTSITIPNSLTTIEEYTFGGNKLTSIVIPNSITNIKLGAFYENLLTSISIPNSVTVMGQDVFGYNRLTNITFGSGISNIEYRTFRNNQLTSVTIPSNVATIETQAFVDNPITSVTVNGTPTTRFNSLWSSIGFGQATMPQ